MNTKYGAVTRYMSKSLFSRKLKNGELSNRLWLTYSKIKGSVFCTPCRLFSGSCQLSSSSGFCDWKNAPDVLKNHENSEAHKDNVLLLGKISTINQIDNQLIKQQQKEKMYWRDVLKRVVAVVIALSSRGLPFRGTDEHFGSPSNGNFLMLLELIAEFDTFLAEHIKRYGNAGSGKVSYLSKETCYEFIEIMAK